MTLRLQDKPNVTPPGGDYSYGNIKDDTGSDDGTPLNQFVHADFHQTFARILDKSTIVANGLVDNNANGYQLYQAVMEAVARECMPFYALAEALSGVYAHGLTFGFPFRLIGVLQTSPTVITAGYIYYNHVFYRTTGWSGTITDTAVFTETSPGALTITDAVSGSGLFDYSEIVDGVNAGLKTKIVDIGDWNMDITATINIAHGITDWTKIRTVNIIIRNDTDSLRYPFVSNQSDGSYQIGSTNIALQRIASGAWDNANFDSTSYNRGFITIDYLP